MEGFSLPDRIAVVTGGGQSLGLAISRALRGAGAEMVIAEVNDQTGPGDTGGPDAAGDGGTSSSLTSCRA
jgi:NAD(P)-dependent dehydrogenase (short-subunit alcohol dehydrogenase family)